MLVLLPLAIVSTLFAPLSQAADLSPIDVFAPKNIAFVSTIGGSSHVNWVLEILGELSDRGHKTTFFASDDHLKFGKPYPRLTTVRVDEELKLTKETIQTLGEHPVPRVMYVKMINYLRASYPSQYRSYMEAFKSSKVDLVICDHFMAPCVDAAYVLNIPLVVTSTLATTPDTTAPYINNNLLCMDNPTTEYESLAERLYNKFICPLSFYISARHELNGLENVKASVNAPAGPDFIRSADGVKLINSAFGLHAARPLGPLVEMVGPIIKENLAPMSSKIQNFMDRHDRVVYIAFGQHAFPTDGDVKLLLIALLDAMEEDVIDSFLWATVKGNEQFPSQVTTSSGRVVDVAQMLNNQNEHVYFVDWAPQQTILRHPSTEFFLSHGGAGSIGEALLAGVRLLIFPFFGDQPQNAQIVATMGLGGTINFRGSQAEASAELRQVAMDVDGTMQNNVNQYQAMLRIRSRSGIKHGADIVEEISVMHKNGKIPHRYPASRNMSFIKANNIDLYIVAFFIVSAVVLTIWKSVRYALNLVSVPAKQKTQ